MMYPLHFALPLLATCAHAVTVYWAPGQAPFNSATVYTGAAAYNPTTLAPPPVPTSPPPTTFSVQLAQGDGPLSIPQNGSFLGFSIEMSVANQILGKNSTLINVPFLNLMANLVQRSGQVNIRVGGNSQESAQMVPVGSIPDGRIISKNSTGAIGTTSTPPIMYTPDLLYMMRNISSFTNVHWYLGVPFGNMDDLRLDIVEVGQAVLGEYLIAMQVGNEPDLYPGRRRADNYTQYDYFGDFGEFVAKVAADNNIPNKGMFLAPSVSGNWSPESVFDTGLVDSYDSSLSYLAVEHYPTDNCAAQFHTGAPIRDPNVEFPTYLTHTSATGLVQPYLNSSAYALSKGKSLLMFETNTASCGGFAGISNVYAAAIWGVDFALQMASVNFSQALFHIGGQNVFYNPFTPPPTNESTFHEWTIGPLYYSTLVLAEAMGPSNQVQVRDIGANNNNQFTPGYAFYENGVPVRALFINFINDPSGASDYTANVAITGQNPSSVKVKYLSATSVSQKGNYTWAGQTYGVEFQSDGRPVGDEDIQTVNCANGACPVKVPAPGLALVFLNNNLEETATSPTTFSTTAYTKTRNTATVASSVLATSNGQRGMAAVHDQSTSFGSSNGSNKRKDSLVGPWIATLAFTFTFIVRLLY